jgi:hypothetical protein
MVSDMFLEYSMSLTTCVLLPTVSTDDVLFIKTSGFAEDISPSEEFKDLVLKIADGLDSPLIELA